MNNFERRPTSHYYLYSIYILYSKLLFFLFCVYTIIHILHTSSRNSMLRGKRVQFSVGSISVWFGIFRGFMLVLVIQFIVLSYGHVFLTHSRNKQYTKFGEQLWVRTVLNLLYLGLPTLVGFVLKKFFDRKIIDIVLLNLFGKALHILSNLENIFI